MLVWLARLGGNRRASASLLGAFFMLTTAVIVVFTIELSDLYIIQLRVQRAADLAVMAATVGGSAPVLNAGAASASDVATALNVVNLNGFGGAIVRTTGAAPAAGAYTLTTSIAATPPPIMGSWMGAASPVVTASAQALMTPVVVSDCIATFGGVLQISGAATASAPACGLASQSTIAMSSGAFTALTAAVGVRAYDEIPQITGGSASPGTSSFMYNATTVDRAAANPSITALQAHLQSLASWPYGSTIPQMAVAQTVPSGSAQVFTGQTVTVPANTHWGALTLTGATLNFAGSGGADINCASPTTVAGATQLNGSNTLSFASGCYIFNGSVSTDAGGASSITKFTVKAGATVVFCFQNTINMNLSSGGALIFGNAYSYSFIGDINSNNSGTFSVGTGTKLFSGNITDYNGPVLFGNGTSYLKGTTIFSGYNLSTGITFGNGPFYMWNGTINNSQNGNTSFGTGPFYFYNSTISNGTYGQGSVTFAGGNYYFYGGSISTGQNYFSRMTFNTGDMDLYAGANISVASPLRIGNGSTSSGSTTLSLYGGSVTINANYLSLTGGTLAMTTGTFTVMPGTIFYGAPPTSATPSYGRTNIALLSTGGTINFSGGTSYIGGLVYAPNSAVAVSGSAILQPYTYSPSTCLSLVANTLALSGNSSTSLSPCTGLSAATTGNKTTLNQ